MTTARDRGLAAALADARDRPDGAERCAELERIASRADATGDPRTALSARFALVEAYLHRGERWRAVEPVRRMRATLARHPGLLDARPDELTRLRRHQRQAVEASFGTPRVGLDQARSLLDALAAELGEDAAPVAELRCRLADHLGDEPAARRAYERWSAADATDPVGGCAGCAPARRADLLAGWGEPDAAVAAMAPALAGWVEPQAATAGSGRSRAGRGGSRAARTERGEPPAGPAGGDEPRMAPSVAGCTDQPERALAVGLLPWLRTGAVTRAARAHVRAYRRHRGERTAFPLLAAHLRFCALGGYLHRGLEILTEQLPELDRPADDLSAMEFAAAGALLCGLATEAGLGGRRIHRPGHGSRPAAEVDVATLGTQLQALATALAGSFDARNGTGHQSGRIASWLAERPLAAPVSLAAESEFDEEPEIDPADPGPPGPEEPAPLDAALLAAALDARGEPYTPEPDGTLTGRWGEATIQFRLLGRLGDVLHARVVAQRRLPAGRRAEAYAFCNAWNHDRLLPAAYVHEPGDGTLVLAAGVSTDLSCGVAPAQLAVLVAAAVRTGTAYAEAVAALP
ncbi:YbjN domain-containing protein [Micromonospora sp. AMSO1212t]|uniref:YbjN domain-containing protein n=1 Tax=Micromonospora sp. AMSO1212t TaxID=2650565 RepID=UPI00124B66BC|nr:YbjN domain-containing protein [Micromonospora sp. AMSO1212t]KAB1904090.1 YbjN domain-containing protein [Micromonospora sp. AMSO1212t]